MIENITPTSEPITSNEAPRYVVSLDIACEKITGAILDQTKSVILKPSDFVNGLSGYEWLQTQLVKLQTLPAQILIGMEATGRYWENCYHYFARRGYQMILLNPQQTHQWANRRSLRAKTDKLDSLTIGRLLLSEEARPGYVASDLIVAYRELVRLHTQLSKETTRYKNEIHALQVVLFPEFSQVFANVCGPTALKLLQAYPSAQAFLEAGVEAVSAKLSELAPRKYGLGTAQTLLNLAQKTAASGVALAARTKSLGIVCEQLLSLQGHLVTLEAEIANWLAQDKGIAGLQSVAEFGPKTQAVLRAELGEVERFARLDQVVAYAGLDLEVKQSGKYKGQTKLSKRGSGLLRQMLYLAAMSSLKRKGSAFRAYYEAMVARGLKGKAALVAVMRKMLAVAFHLLKNGGEYDPTKVWAGAQAKVASNPA